MIMQDVMAFNSCDVFNVYMCSEDPDSKTIPKLHFHWEYSLETACEKALGQPVL